METTKTCITDMDMFHMGLETNMGMVMGTDIHTIMGKLFFLRARLLEENLEGNCV